MTKLGVNVSLFRTQFWTNFSLILTKKYGYKIISLGNKFQFLLPVSWPLKLYNEILIQKAKFLRLRRSARFLHITAHTSK